MDCDMIEYRYEFGKLVIKAFCEYKCFGAKASKSQREVLIRLAQKSNAKALLIYYEEGERLKDSRLEVQEIFPNEETHYFDVEQFRDWIRSL